MQSVRGADRVLAGRYRLQDPIGRGAMGIVWRGRDELLHRDVAVKEVQIGAIALPADGSCYQRTLREARAAARLSHPSVVTIFDIVEEQGSPWIVMELVVGRSLDRLIAEDGPLPPRQAAELGTALLGALAAAHAAGVLHRDVKPGNVLVTDEGRAVLTDFGIAIFAEDPGQTQVGMVVGTPGFTAPERVRGRGATPASDLWSLGATLYAAVEGRGPFDRPGGAAEITAGVAAEDPPRAPSAGPLAPVIDALLRRDPADRPGAAAAAALLAEATLDPTGARAGSGWLRSGHRGTDTATAALAGDGPAGQAAGPSFLDPPVYAELRMPGPAGYDGAGHHGRSTEASGAGELPEFLDLPSAGSRRPGRQASGFPAADDARTDAPGGAGAMPARQPDGPAGHGPRARYWRLAVADAGIAAIVVAALLGSTIYSRTLTGSPDEGTGQAAAGASNASRAGLSASPLRGTGGSGRAAAPGQSPGATAAGRTSPASSAETGGTGSSAPDSIGSPRGAPPAGFHWHTITGASVHATAGLVIALPDRWQVTTEGQDVFATAPADGARVEVSLTPFAHSGPVREARSQQAAALAASDYPGYRKIAIDPTRFRSVAAASWRFSWKPPATPRTGAWSILATLPTSSGDQPYELSVFAPSTSFAAARAVFEQSVMTFSPLPPG